jgi:meiotically up-regulated gene 157 (Mug157) protein
MAPQSSNSPPRHHLRRKAGGRGGRPWLDVLFCAVITTSVLVYNATSNVMFLKQQEKPSSHHNKLLQLTDNQADAPRQEETMASLRSRLPPCVWSRAGSNSDVEVAKLVELQLSQQETNKAKELCGKFLYSSIIRAVRVGDMGEQTFVSTGDIDKHWTRDSAVQISLYVSRMRHAPFLRPIIEGAIRRQAFNTIQDPYANAYERSWVDPSKVSLRDSVIGRGGWVATRNYELDSGAYFFHQIYDYYVAEGLYKPELLLAEPLVFDAVMLMVDTWIVEQHHETQSPYRYFELPQQGLGPQSNYTGMTWTGFRPSDDPSTYGYLVPANIFAAGGLERILIMNERIWHSQELHERASKLLREIEDGIRKFGIVTTQDTGEAIYAYEVDGLGNALVDFDDANVPSLLSIPLLGWSGYDKQVYKTTRERLLSTKNSWYFNGTVVQGIGSPHTGRGYAWPMAFAIQALTHEGSKQELADSFVFQLRQSLTAACRDAMHESVNAEKGCTAKFTREWFEWSNALFVVLFESALGIRCDAYGMQQARNTIANYAQSSNVKQRFYADKYKNNHTLRNFYQGIEALVPHYE